MFPAVESVCLTCFGGMFLLLPETGLNACSFLDSSNMYYFRADVKSFHILYYYLITDMCWYVSPASNSSI